MFDNQKKITMSCRKVFIRSFYKSGSSRLTACRDDNFLLNSAVKGFTLIELLVVVLIISILAAVALPQYQVAVAKARFVQAMALGDALWQAEQLYYMENGTWTDVLEDLDVGMPAGAISSSTNKIYYQWGTCELRFSENTRTASCRVLGNSLVFLRGFTNNNRYCRAYLNTPQWVVAEKVCKSSMGTYYSKNDDIGYVQYLLP